MWTLAVSTILDTLVRNSGTWDVTVLSQFRYQSSYVNTDVTVADIAS
jgi:hypothetical protein